MHKQFYSEVIKTVCFPKFCLCSSDALFSVNKYLWYLLTLIINVNNNLLIILWCFILDFTFSCPHFFAKSPIIILQNPSLSLLYFLSIHISSSLQDFTSFAWIVSWSPFSIIFPSKSECQNLSIIYTGPSPFHCFFTP